LFIIISKLMLSEEQLKNEVYDDFVAAGCRLYIRFNSWLSDTEPIAFDDLSEQVRNAWIMASHNKTKKPEKKPRSKAKSDTVNSNDSGQKLELDLCEPKPVSITKPRNKSFPNPFKPIRPDLVKKPKPKKAPVCNLNEEQKKERDDRIAEYLAKFKQHQSNNLL